MILKLYLANFPPEASEEQLQNLFASVGTISQIKVLENKNAEQSRALLWLDTEQDISDVLTRFNGHLLDGYRLFLSPSKYSAMPLEPTAEQRQFAEALAAKLGESEPEPCQQIIDIIRLCSTSFAQAVLDETLEVEAGGGMAVRDGSRQRTRGGIFFYLARGHLSFGLQQIIVPHLRNQAKSKAEQGKPKTRAIKAPAPVVPLAAPPSEEEMIAIQQKLDDLRCDHAAAQSRLDQLRAQPADKQTGMFSAIKQVLDIQRQIDQLLKEYPFLKSS